MKSKSLEEIDRIIEMAWEDRTPFEAIFNQFDINGRMVDSMFYYFDADTDKLIKVDGGTKWN